MEHVYDYMLHLVTEYAKLLSSSQLSHLKLLRSVPNLWSVKLESIEKKFLMRSMAKSAHDSGPCDLPPPLSPPETQNAKTEERRSVLITVQGR